MQNTGQLLMIRPLYFGFNTETVVNNAFQSASSDKHIQEKALKEFDHFAALLIQHELDVVIVEDTPDPLTPDAVFPNNWISFHENGHLILYPMFANNRRKERKKHVLDAIRQRFIIKDILDLSCFEKGNRFLEGTGSMVLDRDHHIAYACLSPRTHMDVLDEFCRSNGYTAVTFTAVDAGNIPVYHTNVMMSVADKYVIICLDCIVSATEREKIIQTIQETQKAIIPISLAQLNAFAGNMLQVINQKGEPLLIMSTQAFQSLTREQLAQLNSYNHMLHTPLFTIEKTGGGSARCMLAEIFLQRKEQ